MRRLFLCVSLCAAIISCSKEPSAVSANIPAADSFPITGAWLAERLPANTLAYARVPSPFGLVSAPKGNNLDTFLRSRAHVDIVEQLLTGLDANVVNQPGIDFAPLEWLINHQRSPIEISVGPIPGSRMQTPVMTLTMRTGFTQPEGVHKAVTELFEQTNTPATLEAFDEDGIAKLSGLPSPAAIGFDKTSSRLLMMMGPGINAERIATTRTALADALESTPIDALQNRIDDSGQGLFYWISAKQALEMAGMFIPPDVAATIAEMGLTEAEAIALGYGVADGKVRASLIADVPAEQGMRTLIPVPDIQLDFGVTAAPRGVFVVNIPSLEEVKAFINEVSDGASGGPDEEMDEMLDTVNQMLGTDIEALYGLIDHTSAYVQDPVGSYVALRVADKDGLMTAIQEMADAHDSPVASKTISGRQYHHWKFPSAVDMAMKVDDASAALDQQGMDGIPAAFLDFYGRMGTHFFWTFDGEFMLMASAPQTLIDRARRGTPLQLDDWLQESEGQDFRKSAFAFHGSMEGIPRFAHSMYISSLTALSDIAATPLDYFSLPSADDLGLPERGSIGMNITMDERLLAFEMTFEHSPLDALGGGGGLVAIAAVGVVAAIAVPAYEDYTVRSQVSEGITLAAATRSLVEAHYLENERFPDALEAEDFYRENQGQYAGTIAVEPESGIVLVYFDGGAANDAIYDQAVYFVPEVIENEIDWTCYGDFEAKYLPAVCR